MTTYQAGDSITITADTTLYALWELQTFTLSYDANGGSGAPDSQTLSYGVAGTVSSSSPSYSGYKFLGWSTSSTATSATYAAGASITIYADTTLYAVWTPYLTITYDANGGSGAPSSSTGTSSTTTSSTWTTTVSTTVPTYSGYNFLGWATSNSAATADYASGASITITASITLYAVWEKADITVSFDANGGTGAPDSVTAAAGMVRMPSTVPTRAGYVFLYWSNIKR